MFSLVLIPVCSIMNRARGTQFFNLAGGTVAGRVLAMEFIAAQVAICSGNILLFPAVWVLMMLWCSFAWDAYWGAEIGESPHTKLWGCTMMFLRQLLILPAFAVVAYFGHSNWLYCAVGGGLWLPYYLYGLTDPATAIGKSEYTIGALIGLTFALLITTTR